MMKVGEQPLGRSERRHEASDLPVSSIAFIDLKDWVSPVLRAERLSDANECLSARLIVDIISS